MSFFPKKAMILAAGLGQRMRPLTLTVPKPMIEVAGRSMIDRALDHLESAGIGEVVVNTAYLADILEAHLEKRSHPSIIFSREDEPLETGGGVKNALPLLGDKPFFVINGDVICMNGDVPYLEQMADAWSDELDVLLLLHPVKDAFGYEGKGDFDLDENSNLIRKPTGSHAYVFTGIQILHPRTFDTVNERVFSLNRIYAAAMSQIPARMKGIVHTGEWLHIGDPETKIRADQYLRA
jgi:MurNAc alpha-1-phosphate uridylyltransferase